MPKFGEFSGIENGRDITRGFLNLVGMYIPTQDSILNLKSGGSLEIYEQVAQDDRVKSCLQQRFAGLTSKEVEVLPGGDKRIDKQAAEHLKMQLDALNWDNTTEKMQWGVFYGYSVAEMLWGKADDKVIIQSVRVRNRRRFRFGIDQLPRLLSFDNPLGETLPEQKFWHFCVGADHDDEPYGRGLAHWLYWLTWFKRNDLRWWITFLENFADPSTVGTYPAGATAAEKATLEGAVRSLGKSKWAIKPEGMLVELVEASRSGAADYQAMYDTINSAISQVILSQNMTTESGSSESQARVHQDVGDSVIESDDALISGSFNAGPARWLTEWNFPGAAIPIVQRKLEPEEDLKASAERDKIIVDMGFPANPEYIVEKYGEGFKPIESESTPVALNGVQLQAFVSLISQAQQGGWSPEMVRTSLEISFPHVPDALLDKMANSMKAVAAPGADPNNPQVPAPSPQTPEQAAQSLDAVAAQFASAPAKKKNCKTGISCGNACISALKTCKKPLTDEQKEMKPPIVASAGVEVKAKPIDAKKDGEPKIEKPEAKSKAKAKPELSDAEKESIAAKVDATKAKDPNSKIENQKDFESKVIEIYNKVLDDDDDGVLHIVPIHKLRKEIGDRVSKEDFDAYMLKMQADGIFQLTNAGIQSPEAMQGGVKSKFSGMKTHATLLEEYRAKFDTKDLKSKLSQMANGDDPDSIEISPKDIEHARANFMDKQGNSLVGNKTEKMKEESPTLSNDEALALSTWIGSKYASMNAILYGGKLDYGVDVKAVATTDLLAAKALRKLPPVTKEQIERESKKKNEPFDSDKPFGRYMQVDSPEEFVKRYQDALAGDGEVRESTFFATSHIDRKDFGFCGHGTNLTYEVKSKLDGKGSGKYIDHYKNKASEGELLYPPETKFRVAAVIPPTVTGKGKKMKEYQPSSQEEHDKAKASVLVECKITAMNKAGKVTGKGYQAELAKAYQEKTGEPLPSKKEQEVINTKSQAVSQKAHSYTLEQHALQGGKNRDRNWIIQLEEI